MKVKKKAAKPKAAKPKKGNWLSRQKPIDGMRARITGKSGLGVRQFVAKLFVENEKAKTKKTDKELARILKKEFAPHKSDSLSRVSMLRCQYNRGDWHEKGERPKIQSQPYDAMGWPAKMRIRRTKAELEQARKEAERAPAAPKKPKKKTVARPTGKAAKAAKLKIRKKKSKKVA